MDVGRVSRTNDAVSPVVGTAFLVTIAVITVAIVAMVSMGLVQSHDAKDVGIQVTSDHTDVIVTFFTGTDVGGLKALRVSVAGNPYVTESQSTDTTGAIRQVGVPIRFTGVGAAGTHTTTVTGIFHDNTVVMLWTGKLTFDPWPANAYSKWNDGYKENIISVTIPSDWKTGNLHGEYLDTPVYPHFWTWEKQLVASVYDSSGSLIKSETYDANDISVMMNLGTDSISITSGENGGFRPGTYHVEVTGQVVDYTSVPPATRSSVSLYTGSVSVPVHS